MNATTMKQRKTRKGFSLVELVVVILIIAILAVAVFAGGSVTIKKSQVSRTTSDLHNFSIAIEAALNETPSVANMNAKTFNGAANDMTAIVKAVNDNLSADYKLDTTSATGVADVSNKNLNIKNVASALILQSDKTDAWNNPYYVIFDHGDRHCKGQSDFYITVVSAGPNAQTTVGDKIEADDIYLLVQYSDGDVAAATYNVADANLYTTQLSDAGGKFEGDSGYTGPASASATTYKLDSHTKDDTVQKGNGGSLLYAGGADSTTAGYVAGLLTVNF